MTIQEIVTFFQAGEAAGKQKYGLRQELQAQGVPAEMIDAALAVLRGEAEMPSADAPATAAPSPTVTAVARGAGVPAWVFPVLAVGLLVAYFVTFSRFYGPSWIVQYLVVLLVWAWIAKNSYQVGLLGSIAIAVLTAAAIFLAGPRMMTLNFVAALLFVLIGRRWQTSGARIFAIGINVVFLIWFIAGLASRSAQLPLF